MADGCPDCAEKDATIGRLRVLLRNVEWSRAEVEALCMSHEAVIDRQQERLANYERDLAVLREVTGMPEPHA